jgi:hypothetical protein
MQIEKPSGKLIGPICIRNQWGTRWKTRTLETIWQTATT